MNTATWTAVVSGALSLVILAVAYVFLWRRTRQPSMALWAVGWTAYALHFVLDHVVARGTFGPPAWRYVDLAALGLSGFFLCAGTYSFAGQPFSARTYGWAALPLVWALAAIAPPPVDVRLVSIPIFAFSAAVDLFTAFTLARRVRTWGRHGIAWGFELAYAAWAGLKIARPLIPLDAPGYLAVAVVTDGLALATAFSLIGLSLVDAERSARRRQERLNALGALTAAAGHLVSADELLETAVHELEQMLELEEGVGIFLYPEGPEGGTLRLVAGTGIPDPCRDGIVHEACIQMQAIRLGHTVVHERPSPPSPPCPADCPLTLAVPMSVRGRPIGAVGVAVPANTSLTGGDLHTLETLVQQLGLALENTRLAEARSREIDRLQSLAMAARWIAFGPDLEQALRGLTRAGLEVIGADRSAVFLYDAESDTVSLGYARGLSEEYLRHLIENFSDTPDYRAVRTLHEVLVEDVWYDPRARALWEAARREGFRSYLVLPLVRQRRAIGTLAFYSDRYRTYDPEDRRFCQALADQAAAAVENALLHQETQRRLDELQALHEIETHIASALDLQEVLTAIAEEIQRVFEASTLYIGLYDARRDELHMPLIMDQGKRLDPLTIRLPEDGGFSGWVIRTRQPLWVDDFEREADRLPVQPIQLGELPRTVAVLPLVIRDSVVGVLSVQFYAPNALDPYQKRLLGDIAHQVAVAVENARLYNEMHRRLAQTQVLREVMLAAASTLDFDQILDRTIRTLQEQMRVEFLCFALPDPDGEGLRLHPAQIGYPTPAEKVRLSLDRSVCGRAFTTGRPLRIGDVRQVPYYHEGASEVRSELAVPVFVGDKAIGVLNVESAELDAFSEEDEAFYTAIASQLGVVLENARLYREEQRRRQEAETLYRAVQALTTTLDLHEVLDRILTELQQVVPYDSASVQLLEEGVLKIIGGRGFPNLDELLGISFDPQREDNPNGRVLDSRQPVILEDAPAEYENFRRPPHSLAKIRAWMGVPLLFGDNVIGMIALDKREPGFYTAEHARLAVAYAAQAAIAIENARLYQRLEEQSAQLAQAVQELQDLDRLRNQVVQNVSHELRTPLTLIQGYTELLLGGGLGTLSASQKRALTTIQEYARTLGRLIYNLTALRTFPRETLAPMPLSIAEVIEHVLTEQQPQAEKNGVRFLTDFPADLPPVLGDRERLDLVFYHLIDNAIKFSPDGGDVVVRAWADDEWVYVSVKDQGIGIAPEHLDRIFQRFYQVDGSTRRRFGGMGIGLALVWEIVEAHGGRVDVSSQPGQGSQFTITLPRAKEAIW